MNIFEEGSPFQRFLNRMADLLVLNLITLLMCIPLITAGAALTAMHYVLLKMVRGEEGYIVKSFFRSFKREFRQATVLWIMYVLLTLLMMSNLEIVLRGDGAQFPIWLPGAIVVVSFLEIIFMIYTFALQSRFENTVFHTLINAVTLTFAELPRSLEMGVITVVPLFAIFRASVLLPIIFLFGLSVPAYACAMIYNPVFKKIEKQIPGAEKEDEEEPEEQD